MELTRIFRIEGIVPSLAVFVTGISSPVFLTSVHLADSGCYWHLVGEGHTLFPLVLGTCIHLVIWSSEFGLCLSLVLAGWVLV